VLKNRVDILSKLAAPALSVPVLSVKEDRPAARTVFVLTVKEDKPSIYATGAVRLVNVPTGLMGGYRLPLKLIPPAPQLIDVCVASIINKPLGPTTVFLISNLEAI
jgi:hypothetical protein